MRAVLAGALATLGLVVVGVGALPAFAGVGPGPAAAGNPFKGVRLFVDPASNASRQVAAWRRWRPRQAALMHRIAREPQADWFGAPGRVAPAVRARVSRARRAGALPVLVAYGIPFRDCGGYSRGGARSGSAYRRWIRAFARGIGGARAVVVLEPDALAGLDCLPARRRRERLALMRFAVGVLASRRGVSLYVDAGHSHWHPASRMAARLRAVGAARARGVSLNVANFRWDATEIRYGRELADEIPGIHVVIDTSRSGRGPVGRAWCNPPGRGLGRRPQSILDDPDLDAYLWIKRPGESDGTCNGGKPAGSWWPSYALGLARRARL